MLQQQDSLFGKEKEKIGSVRSTILLVSQNQKQCFAILADEIGDAQE